MFNRGTEQSARSVLDIQPEMVIWLQYIKKFQEFEKQFNVTLIFKRYQLIKLMKGIPQDVSCAKQFIERFVNDEYRMNYLYRDESYRRDAYVPFQQITHSEVFKKMKDLQPEVCIMSKKKFLEQIIRIQENFGFKGCDGIMNRMPKEFILIFCKRVEKDDLIKQILQIADNTKAEDPAKEFIDKGIHTKSSEKIKISKYDLIWLSLYLDLERLSQTNHFYIDYKDVEQSDFQVYMQIQSSHQRQIDSLMDFIFKENLQQWTMKKLKILNFVNPMIEYLREYFCSNYQEREIVIYQEDQVIQTAKTIDLSYSTTVTEYLLKTIQQRKGIYLTQLKAQDQYIFLLAEKSIMGSLLQNAENYLLSIYQQNIEDIVDLFDHISISQVKPLELQKKENQSVQKSDLEDNHQISNQDDNLVVPTMLKVYDLSQPDSLQKISKL